MIRILIKGFDMINGFSRIKKSLLSIQFNSSIAILCDLLSMIRIKCPQRSTFESPLRSAPSRTISDGTNING